MSWLELRPENTPTALRVLLAVLWRGEPRKDGKPAKVPYRICAPRRRASSTNPATWGLFADAVEAYAALRGQDDPVRGPVAGVGCILVQDRETSCIDLDRVIDEHGTLDVRADTIVGRAHSFTELSPGGRGLHVFILGAIPKAIVGDQIEIYSTARVITFDRPSMAGHAERGAARAGLPRLARGAGGVARHQALALGTRAPSSAAG
jgi:primase-polymerase (primpol)-like protein